MTTITNKHLTTITNYLEGLGWAHANMKLLKDLLFEVKCIVKAPHKAIFETRYFISGSYLLLLAEVLVLALIIKIVPCEENFNR